MMLLITVVTLLAPLVAVAYLARPMFSGGEETHDLEWVLVFSLVVIALLGTFTSGWFISALWYRPENTVPVVAIVWASLLAGWLVAVCQGFRRVSRAEDEFFKERKAKEFAEHELSCADMLFWERSWFITDLDLAILESLERTGPQPNPNVLGGWPYKEGEVKMSLWKLKRSVLVVESQPVKCIINSAWDGDPYGEEERDGARLSLLSVTEKGLDTVNKCYAPQFSYSWTTHDRNEVQKMVAVREGGESEWRKFNVVEGGPK